LLNRDISDLDQKNL